MPIIPDFDAATFAPRAPINNPYFPLTRGTVSTYGGSAVIDGELTNESNDVFVSRLYTTIMGVQVQVVRDTAYDNGVLVEDTLDFYAQDTDGNVWYFGEIVNNFIYDEDGNFVETTHGGSWQAGVDGALPGWIMAAALSEGLSFFSEVAPGVAVDEVLIAELGVDITTGFGSFSNVIRTFDTTALDLNAREFKYYAPGIGAIRFDEGLDENGIPSLIVELRDIIDSGSSVVPFGAEAPEAGDFVGAGTTQYVTVVCEDSGQNNALGFYTYNLANGVIGEARILVTDTAGLAAGTQLAIDAPAGRGVGFFLIPDGGNLGIDLAQFMDGGLFFENFLTGAAARINNGLGPMPVDANGTPLPLSIFHVLGGTTNGNFLNPGMGLQAVKWEVPGEENVDGLSFVGFEDLRPTLADFDGDFDDFIIAFSDAPLDELPESDTPIIGGTGADTLTGTWAADAMHGGGNGDTMSGGASADSLFGNSGNDTLSGDGGADLLHGGLGGDHMSGGRGDDRYYVDNSGDLVIEEAGHGIDTIYATLSQVLSHHTENLTLLGFNAINGTGNALANILTGNAFANVLAGGSGADKLVGGNGGDTLRGGLGLDRLTGGNGADKFVFDTAPALANRDLITDFSLVGDTIQLDNAVFAGIGAAGALAAGKFRIGAAAIDATDRIIYQAGTGKLFFDADGTGAGAQIHFATLDPGLALTHLDFLVI